MTRTVKLSPYNNANPDINLTNDNIVKSLSLCTQCRLTTVVKIVQKKTQKKKKTKKKPPPKFEAPVTTKSH